MQIIQTLDESIDLSGKVVTLSVYARVLEYNNNRTGGTVGIINGTDYENGVFYAKTDFINKEWKRINLSVRLPQKEDYKGLTICLRAIAGTGDMPAHASVEFSEPKLELGSFSTKFS